MKKHFNEENAEKMATEIWGIFEKYNYPYNKLEAFTESMFKCTEDILKKETGKDYVGNRMIRALIEVLNIEEHFMCSVIRGEGFPKLQLNISKDDREVAAVLCNSMDENEKIRDIVFDSVYTFKEAIEKGISPRQLQQNPEKHKIVKEHMDKLKERLGVTDPRDFKNKLSSLSEEERLKLRSQLLQEITSSEKPLDEKIQEAVEAEDYELAEKLKKQRDE